MAKRQREHYEQIINLAYQGYTGEGISAIVGRKPTNISTMLTEVNLSFKEIRAAKRNGTSYAQLLSGVNWAFLDQKAQNMATRSKNLQKFVPQNANVAKDIADIKTMLAEIYEALTAPKASQSVISKITNGAFRN